MLDQLRELYQEVVFDHNRNPRNFRAMADADRKVEGSIPCAAIASPCISNSALA